MNKEEFIKHYLADTPEYYIINLTATQIEDELYRAYMYGKNNGWIDDQEDSPQEPI